MRESSVRCHLRNMLELALHGSKIVGVDALLWDVHSCTAALLELVVMAQVHGCLL